MKCNCGREKIAGQCPVMCRIAGLVGLPKGMDSARQAARAIVSVHDSTECSLSHACAESIAARDEMWRAAIIGIVSDILKENTLAWALFETDSAAKPLRS